MDELGNPLPGDIIAEKYLIEDVLGEGGMGTVYVARHTITERVVALKWVRTGEQSKQARLLREARSMGRVSHPNVVEVLDAGEFEGAVYMALDYVDGKDLHTYAARRVLPVAHAVDLIVPALKGIRAAHRAGIVHRDLKPANLIVCFDTKGQPMNTKVLDFGVAKLMTAGDGPRLTRTGTMVGTPRYMAPEQLLGEPEVDERTDIYSAGLVLYELLAGRPPYASSDLKELAQDVVSGALPPPEIFARELPSSVSKIVMKAASVSMDDRYQSIDELLLALAPFGTHAPDAEAMVAPVMSSPGSLPARRVIDSAAPTMGAGSSKPSGDETLPELPPTASIALPPPTVKEGVKKASSTVTGVTAVPTRRSARPPAVRPIIYVVSGAAILGAAVTFLWLRSLSGPSEASPSRSAESDVELDAEQTSRAVAPADAARPAPQAEPAQERVPQEQAAPQPAAAAQTPPAPAPAPVQARPRPRPAPKEQPKPDSSTPTLRVEDF